MPLSAPSELPLAVVIADAGASASADADDAVADADGSADLGPAVNVAVEGLESVPEPPPPSFPINQAGTHPLSPVSALILKSHSAGMTSNNYSREENLRIRPMTVFLVNPYILPFIDVQLIARFLVVVHENNAGIGRRHDGGG